MESRIAKKMQLLIRPEWKCFTSRVSTAMIKSHDQKQLGEEKVCFSLQIIIVVHHPGKSGRS